MSDQQTGVHLNEAESSLAAVLEAAYRARVALDSALHAIVRLLDLLMETDDADEEYWSLCDQHERLLLMEELQPELRSLLQTRQKHQAELGASLAAYQEAEQLWRIARRQLEHQLASTDEAEKPRFRAPRRATIGRDEVGQTGEGQPGDPHERSTGGARDLDERADLPRRNVGRRRAQGTLLTHDG